MITYVIRALEQALTKCCSYLAPTDYPTCIQVTLHKQLTFQTCTCDLQMNESILITTLTPVLMHVAMILPPISSSGICPPLP